MFPLILFFIGGYVSGWLIRHGLAQLRTHMGSCNIAQKGISFRSWLAIILIIVAFFFELPLIAFFAGFSWYESRAKWCIAQTIRK